MAGIWDTEEGKRRRQGRRHYLHYLIQEDCDELLVARLD